jgi:hypothetical protein
LFIAVLTHSDRKPISWPVHKDRRDRRVSEQTSDSLKQEIALKRFDERRRSSALARTVRALFLRRRIRHENNR